jgi:hypothetical protein
VAPSEGNKKRGEGAGENRSKNLIFNLGCKRAEKVFSARYIAQIPEHSLMCDNLPGLQAIYIYFLIPQKEKPIILIISC